jgi:hypothetical protein
MKRIILAGLAVAALGLFPNVSVAKDLPSGGMTVDEVAAWLQAGGYKADVQSNKDGSKTVASSTDGTGFFVDMYDCKGAPRCTSIQFSVGFDTKGAWNATKMNEWNADNRWAKAYVDSKDDPWIEMDVDLSPGGTSENLSDEFAVWRDMVVSFKKFINW